MKLEYVCACALQIMLPRQMSEDASMTGLLPKEVAIGTLQTIKEWSDIPSCRRTYHMKLLKPKTKIHTPVNWTAPARSVSNASMSCGNMGAKARGPKPWVKDRKETEVIDKNFHVVVQFCEAVSSTLLVATL